MESPGAKAVRDLDREATLEFARSDADRDPPKAPFQRVGQRTLRFTPPRLTGEETAAEGFRALAFACLRQLDAALTALWDHPSEAATHRARVALRRLRGFVRAFEDMLWDEDMAARKADLRRLADVFADARNLDVFIAEIFQPLARDDAGMAALGQALLAARAAAHERARASLREPWFGRALIDLTAWLAHGSWSLAPGTCAAARRPLARIAREALRHRRKAMVKRGEAIDWNDPLARHGLRIQAKKMRYLAEVFAFDDGSGDRFVDRLKSLQDGLGRLNDIAVGPRVVALALKGATGETAFAAGRLMERKSAKSKRLLRQSRRDFARFAKVSPFWS